MADEDIKLNVKIQTGSSVQEVDALDRKVDDIGKTAKKSSEGFAELGATMAVISAAGVMAISSVISSAVSFEKQMSVVKAVTQTTGNEFKALQDIALSLGASTVYTSEQVAQAMQYLGQAGFTTQEILNSIASTLDLATAGQVDLATASDIAASVLRGFNIDAGETQMVVDTISKAIVTSNTDLNNYAEAMKYLAPIAQTMGISIAEASAIIGIMGDSGEKGSIATRAFGSAITRLTKPTEAMEDVLNELGLTWEHAGIAGSQSTKFFSEAGGEFIGIANMVDLLSESMAGYNQEQRLAALSTLFGADAMQEILILMTAGGEKIRDYSESLRDSEGYAKQLAATQMDNLYGSLELLSGAFDGLKIAIGNEFSPIIKFLAESLTALLDSFNSLPSGVKQFIAGFMLAGTIITGFVAVLALMIAATPSIIAMATAFGILWAAITGPIGLVVAAVVALIATFIYLASKWDEFKAAVITVAGMMVDFVVAKFESLKSFMQNHMSFLYNAIVFGWNAILFFIEPFLAFFELLFTGNMDRMLGLYSGGLEALKNVFVMAWEGIKWVFSSAWDGIVFVVTAAWNGIKAAASAGLDAILGFITFMTQPYVDAFNIIWGAIGGVVTAGAGFVLDVVKGMVNAMITMINTALRGLNSLASAANKLPGIKFNKIPEIPQLAEGGIVNRPTLALIGEAGPEAVVPLSKGKNYGVGGQSITFNFNGPVSSKEVAMEYMDIAVRQLKLSSSVV